MPPKRPLSVTAAAGATGTSTRDAAAGGHQNGLSVGAAGSTDDSSVLAMDTTPIASLHTGAHAHTSAHSSAYGATDRGADGGAVHAHTHTHGALLPRMDSDGEAVLDPSRARRRRDLMLDDAALDVARMEPRAYVAWRVVMYVLLGIITAGTTVVIASWSFCVRRKERLLSRPVRHTDADFLIVENVDKSFEVCQVERVSEQPLELMSWSQARRARVAPSSIPRDQRMIVYRHTRYRLNQGSGKYTQLDPEQFTSLGDPNAAVSGLATTEATHRLTLFGHNIIDVPIPPAIILIIRECVHPFIVFQIWAVIVWLTEAYYSFSAFIFVTAILSAVANFIEVRRNLLQIRAISRYSTTVRVIRDGIERSVDSTRLVPGDIVIVDNDMKLPCDLVLLSGQCTVNEAMLTGESTVVIKYPVAQGRVNDAEARNTLFGGSYVVQLRVPHGHNVLATVVRTGFESVKGRLVLAILFPRVPHFKFLEQSLKFIAVLFMTAMIGFGINAKALADFGAPIEKIVQRGCDMVTIVVPPALPLALTVGVAYALIALRKRNIYCISPPRVNLAGKINCFCFDKTGTLTTEGLELSCIRPSGTGGFLGEVRSGEDLHRDFNALLACCHTLTHVKGKLSGDPLELQTVAFTCAAVDEPHTVGAHSSLPPWVPPGYAAYVRLGANRTGSLRVTEGFEGAVMVQFEFVPALQRMSVITQLPNGSCVAFVKGSPEMMKTLCHPLSIPHDFDAVLREYTHKGFRVLGAGWKPAAGVPDVSTPAALERARTATECDLSFLGFIVLENKLKDATADIIQRLRKEADLSMHMITGDNVVSAVCVARKCFLVEQGYRVFIAELGEHGEVTWSDVDDPRSTLDPSSLMPTDSSSKDSAPYRFAMTGRVFTHLLDQLRINQLSIRTLQRVLLNCAVFARMSPENKASLVERLQETGMYVGMIGDGANDSLALRAAHVGISLSQVEASVSAPFTSLTPDISCIPEVLCEGRGALTTSFCLFQFMALYSTIQFANALLIVFANSFLANNEYLYQDLFVVFILALTLGSTPSSKTLTKKRPSGQLLSAYNLTICFAFIALTFVIQGIVYFRVQRQPWYNTEEYPNVMNPDDDAEGTNSVIPETTSLFLVAMLQYVAVAAIFSNGYPWKQNTLRNYWFSGWLLIVLGASLFLLCRQEPALYNLIGLQILPYSWNLELLAWSWLSFALYFVGIGAVYVLRRAGLFSWCKRRCARDSLKPHKAIRTQWAQQFRGSTDIKVFVSPLAALRPIGAPRP